MHVVVGLGTVHPGACSVNHGVKTSEVAAGPAKVAPRTSKVPTELTDKHKKAVVCVVAGVPEKGKAKTGRGR